jgi:hypothetical protein
MAPPGYTHNQRVPPRSSLEILMKNYVIYQTKQLQELKNQIGILNDSLSKLNTKVESISTHTEMLETQIPSGPTGGHLFSNTGNLSWSTEAHPKAHVNSISFGGSKIEDTIAKARNIEGENVKFIGERAMIESEMLKKICINIPFAEALSQIPLYAKFLKEIFSKKRNIEHNETIALTRESSAIIKKPPPKLRDPGSFAIPCAVGSETIDKALCDLGASVSLLPLSHFMEIGIEELKPMR